MSSDPYNIYSYSSVFLPPESDERLLQYAPQPRELPPAPSFQYAPFRSFSAQSRSDMMASGFPMSGVFVPMPPANSANESPPPKKRKRKKDPKAPTHPLSPYLFFLAENRAEIAHAHPNSSFSEIAQLVSKAWKMLPPERKLEYDVKAMADRDRYADEKRQYLAKKAHEEQEQWMKHGRELVAPPLPPPPPLPVRAVQYLMPHYSYAPPPHMYGPLDSYPHYAFPAENPEEDEYVPFRKRENATTSKQ